MPSPLFADHPAQQPEPGAVDALISQTRRLRGELVAVRRDAVENDDDPQQRWQRALCDLAVHQLDDLGAHLGQLRAGVPEQTGTMDTEAPAEAALDTALATDPGTAYGELPPQRTGSLLSRVGSAEWNLLTDEVSWSEELFQIFGRARESGPLSLDEMPTMVFAEDQPVLQGMVTDCLIDGKPIAGEFRIVRTDGSVRTVHMTGEPVLDSDGCTAS
ncbi:PAS domain-containing protein, partial [Streptomyces sp. SID6041]|nr:PAS domain-containing protein [Streptomyces sp. SID6041]